MREFGSGNGDPTSAVKHNVVEGTPWFTPPEAIRRDGQVDPRTDIYAVGALGYFLLTRHFIFDAATVEEIHQKQLTAAPIPPSQRTDNPVSGEMEHILLRCLEKEASARPQSVGELKALLESCAAAGNWTLEARAAWWEAYHQQPPAGVAGNGAGTSTASAEMATVRIDLASRVE